MQLTPKSNTAVNSDRQGVPDLDSEQWTSLLELLNSHKVNSVEKMTNKDGNTSWIINTGVLNHMTGSLEVLNDLRKIITCPVGMPNGNRLLATDEGSIQLDDNLVLSNVLCVPRLSCNLCVINY